MIDHLESPGGEFNADGGFGFEAELVSGESGEDVGFADTGVADEDDLEQVIVLMVYSIRHFVFLSNPSASDQPVHT